MKIAYITADISHNDHFSFYHDLLANYPVPTPAWNHRVYLIHPNWNRDLVKILKERGIAVEACFEDFQPTMDIYWEKIRSHTEDCDVLISGNITNLDEVLHDNIDKPIVSVSLAEKGYRTSTGGYGSFYKPRFKKVAISKTAIESFPDHVRPEVKVVYGGIDSSRLSQKMTREEVRDNWFPGGKSDGMKLILFIGVEQESKGLDKLVQAMEHLSKDWHVIVLTDPRDLKLPDHLLGRFHICQPTYDIADIFLSCDCFVLPTEHEGLCPHLLEAWLLGIPVITTRHKAMLEIIANNQDVDFGSLVDVDHTPKELAEAVEKAVSSTGATECMFKNYMASNMISNWQKYLELLIN